MMINMNVIPFVSYDDDDFIEDINDALSDMG